MFVSALHWKDPLEELMLVEMGLHINILRIENINLLGSENFINNKNKES